MGVGRFLKEQNPDIQILAVEPPAGESVEGLRSLGEGFIPPIFEEWEGMELLDGKRIIRPFESLECTRKLAQTSGIFAGISSGAALAGALRTVETIEQGNIVFIVCDGGWKYLSTEAWTKPLEEVADTIDRIIYF